MATEPNPDIDDELELTDELVPDDADDTPDDDEDGDDEEEILTFGGDTEESESDTNLVKHLRAEIRERDRRLAEASRNEPAPIEVGEKPTLAGCDFDEEKYEAEHDAWKERKAAAEQQKTASNQAAEQAREEWSKHLDNYRDGKARLGFADADDAEENVKASFDTAQQAVLLMAADDPARLMYALGKHPDRLAQLSQEKNPLKLAAKIAKLEGQLKVVKKRKAPNPDVPERGSARVSSLTADKRLKKLEEEAERTGERTAVVAYKKKLKEAARK